MEAKQTIFEQDSAIVGRLMISSRFIFKILQLGGARFCGF